MRILIIADESFASRERAMLSRLEVGLADEGVRVVHAVPRSALRWHGAELSALTIPYEDRGLSISRPWRARRLVEFARSVAPDADPPFDLVHAFGTGCWAIAQDAARLANAALALEIHSATAAALAVRSRPSASEGQTVHLLPDAALERLVRAGDVGVQVRTTPWGVHTPAVGVGAARPRQGNSVMIAGTGQDRGAMNAVLTALGGLAPAHPGLLVFADEQAARASGAWAQVRALKLAERFTLTPDMEARRELTLRGDILVLPEAAGEHRTLTLDAMAAGMLVIAAEDPLVSVLSDAKTARLVARSHADSWREALGWALEQPAAAAQLAAMGRDHVRQHCRASAHVAAVLGAYEWMGSGASIPFGGPR